jgi:hypothetical protein
MEESAVDDGITKRDMLHMGSMSAAMLFLARPVEAQEGPNQVTELTVAEAVEFHAMHVRERRDFSLNRESVSGRDPLGEENLVLRVRSLVEAGVCRTDQAELLVRLIELLFSPEARERLLERFDAVIEGFEALVTDATEFIVKIYRSSIEIAANLLGDTPWETTQRAIAADFGGAVDGAKLGIRRFGPQGAIVGIVFGAAVMSGFSFASV